MRVSDARVLKSTSFDPFLNLALEERLFRTAPNGTRTLYLWINDPVVVIGRYQNPWLECHLDEMEKDKVAFARRQSGGGAVYHDRGNLCVTFMGPRTGFNRESNIQSVVAALRDLGIAAETNERNDIVIDGLKVSGSAYREIAERSFHHLTLLVDANLDRLTRYLRPKTKFSSAKGVASVRSPVMNLRSVKAGLSMEKLETALARRFEPEALIENAQTESPEEREFVEKTAERWKTWEWRFGNSPEFTLSLAADGAWGTAVLGLKVREGVIVAADEKNANIFSELAGKRFSPASVAAALREFAKKLEIEGKPQTALRYVRYAAEAEKI